MHTYTKTKGYTPQISYPLSGALRRMAWLHKETMVKTLERIVAAQRNNGQNIGTHRKRSRSQVQPHRLMRSLQRTQKTMRQLLFVWSIQRFIQRQRIHCWLKDNSISRAVISAVRLLTDAAQGGEERSKSLRDFLSSLTPPFLHRLYRLQAVTVIRDKKARLTPSFSVPELFPQKLIPKRRKNPGAPPKTFASGYLVYHDKAAVGTSTQHPPRPAQPTSQANFGSGAAAAYISPSPLPPASPAHKRK